MAMVTSGISWLRERITANQELASKIEEQLRELEGKPGAGPAQSKPSHSRWTAREAGQPEGPQAPRAVAGAWRRAWASMMAGRRSSTPIPPDSEDQGNGSWEPVPDRAQFLPLMEARPPGVNVYGLFGAVSGLGSVARSCARALETAETPLHKIAIPSWAEQVAGRSLPQFEPYRTNLILQNPDMLALFFQAYATELLKGC
jgi:hypothetical protein